jgi:hypothetical protein
MHDYPRKNAQARKEWKFRLTRRLYEQGYDRQDILNLFRFIDWLMELPDALKQEFRSELAQYEQERQMPYVTSIEQMGIEQGRQVEKEAIALNALRRKLPLETIAEITELSIEQIRQLQIQLETEQLDRA